MKIKYEIKYLQNYVTIKMNVGGHVFKLGCDKIRILYTLVFESTFSVHSFRVIKSWSRITAWCFASKTLPFKLSVAWHPIAQIQFERAIIWAFNNN